MDEAHAMHSSTNLHIKKDDQQIFENHSWVFYIWAVYILYSV